MQHKKEQKPTADLLNVVAAEQRRQEESGCGLWTSTGRDPAPDEPHLNARLTREAIATYVATVYGSWPLRKAERYAVADMFGVHPNTVRKARKTVTTVKLSSLKPSS
jgi:hypothetical protein